MRGDGLLDWLQFQVLPPLQLAPVGGKAPLPPLSKPPLQPVQPGPSGKHLQPGSLSSSAPAKPTSAQAGTKPLAHPLSASAAVKSQGSLPQGSPLGESMQQPRHVAEDQVGA